MEEFFTKEGTWYGGFYELAVELGERSDDRLLHALEALWEFPVLDGCYSSSGIEPWEKTKIEPSQWLDELKDSDGVSHLYGSATLVDGNNIVCGSVIIREDEGVDWLDFYLPVAALVENYKLDGYPFGNTIEVSGEMRSFFIEFDNWFVEIARHIYSSVPFKLALIGNEVSGDVYSSEIIGVVVPEERWFGYMWPAGENLNYFPRNIWRPEMVFEK